MQYNQSVLFLTCYISFNLPYNSILSSCHCADDYDTEICPSVSIHIVHFVYLSPKTGQREQKETRGQIQENNATISSWNSHLEKSMEGECSSMVVMGWEGIGNGNEKIRVMAFEHQTKPQKVIQQNCKFRWKINEQIFSPSNTVLLAVYLRAETKKEDEIVGIEKQL